MFDVGISEILVIAVVALVVIGPERLPRVARTIGTLLGRAQRYVNDVKSEVNREMELDELRKLQTQMQDAARDIQQQVSSAGAEVQSAVSDAEKQLTEGVNSAATAVSDVTGTSSSGSAATAPASESPPHELLARASAVDGLPTEPAAAETLPPPAQSSLFPEHTIR